MGALTELLAERAGHVIAVEVDRGICDALRVRMADTTHVTVTCEDILQFAWTRVAGAVGGPGSGDASCVCRAETWAVETDTTTAPPTTRTMSETDRTHIRRTLLPRSRPGNRIRLPGVQALSRDTRSPSTAACRAVRAYVYGSIVYDRQSAGKGRDKESPRRQTSRGRIGRPVCRRRGDSGRASPFSAAPLWPRCRSVG